MTIVDYIPSLVAFCAVVVGIAGRPKWDATQAGMRRLTPAGRLTVGIAVLALVASWGITWRSHASAATSAQQRAQVRSMAHDEICDALIQCIHPFFELFGDRRSGLVPASVLDRDRVLKVAEIPSESSLSGLSGSNYGMSWASLLQLNAKLGTEAIDRVLQTYLAYIDPELADVVRKIRKSHYLFRMRDNGHCYPLGRAEEIGKVDTPHGSEEYEEFWTLMRLAESKLK
jgi:hypothetical protein